MIIAHHSSLSDVGGPASNDWEAHDRNDVVVVAVVVGGVVPRARGTLGPQTPSTYRCRAPILVDQSSNQATHLDNQGGAQVELIIV